MKIFTVAISTFALLAGPAFARHGSYKSAGHESQSPESRKKDGAQTRHHSHPPKHSKTEGKDQTEHSPVTRHKSRIPGDGSGDGSGLALQEPWSGEAAEPEITQTPPTLETPTLETPTLTLEGPTLERPVRHKIESPKHSKTEGKDQTEHSPVTRHKSRIPGDGSGDGSGLALQEPWSGEAAEPAITRTPPTLETPTLETPILETPILERPTLERPTLERPTLERPVRHKREAVAPTEPTLISEESTAQEIETLPLLEPTQEVTEIETLPLLEIPVLETSPMEPLETLAPEGSTTQENDHRSGDSILWWPISD